MEDFFADGDERPSVSIAHAIGVRAPAPRSRRNITLSITQQSHRLRPWIMKVIRTYSRVLEMELTNQKPESHPAAAAVLTPPKRPDTGGERPCLVEKGSARVPGSHPPCLALRLGGIPRLLQASRAPAVAGVALDRRRLHRGLRRRWQKARHRPPLPRDYCLRASSGKDHQSK